MKKTLTINLAGMVYHIDEDAFDILTEYLRRVKEELSYMEGKEEILQDIEMRIAELFSERVKNINKSITAKDVEEIMAIMGNPHDIAGSQDNKKQSHEKKNYKRMYRDPDSRIVGGVCSGLAAYWSVDPVIVRVVFILLAIFGMAGVFIYLILWIVLPEAKTIAQKLEMRGEPVNLSNIGDFFRDEFENIKRNFKKDKGTI